MLLDSIVKISILLGAGSLISLIYILVSDLVLYLRLPPGPRPIPIIGNKHQVPAKYPWMQFKSWAKEYGPVYTLWLGRRPTIIVSDPWVAVELLEKRSNKYSSRPRSVAMGELYWDMASILVQPYGKTWSIRRKLLHSGLTPAALEGYKPVQEAEASRLCFQLLAQSKDWEPLLDRLTSSIVFSIAYGHRIDSLQSPIIRQRMKFMHYSASLNVPGAYLVESFPFLKYAPDSIAPWKAIIKSKGKEEAAVNMKLVEDVKQDMAEARAAGIELPRSFTSRLLEAKAKDPSAFALLSDRDFSFVPASLFGAGSDTTASTLCSAFLALVTHGETLSAVHSELDHVIGSDRLPTFADESSLPYLRSFCKEVLRWRPVAVLGGTPHATSAADEYKGYYIPANTNILTNSWAINLSEEYYPNPHHFNPLRFLDHEPSSLQYLPKDYVKSTPIERGKAHPSKTGHSSFGWGRRICPGADLAQNTLFVALARLLWAYDILPAKGVQYDIWDYVGGFNVRPKHFECQIRIRDAQHESIVRAEYERASDVMAKFPLFKEHEHSV